MTAQRMMIDPVHETLLQDLLKRARRISGDGQTPVFSCLVESIILMEKALAGLTRCQAQQTSICLSRLSNQPALFTDRLLMNWLEASNRWVEALVMVHWIAHSRLQRIMPYGLRCHSNENQPIPSAILEAQVQSVLASLSMAEAQIQLLAQIISKFQPSPAVAHCLDKLEKESLLSVDSVGDMLRILVRKQDLFQTFDNGKVPKVDRSVQEKRTALFRSLKWLESQTANSPLLSKEFMGKLRETLRRLIESYGVIEHSSPIIYRTGPPLPKPWLNEDIFGHVSKGRKKE